MPKTPISYYGGKQNMLTHILPNIPEHRIYTEVFFGGGAVFFAKKPVESEVVNDIQGMVTNFYKVCKTNFTKLKQEVESTLFARDSYTDAWLIYRKPQSHSKVLQAWAFYVGTNMGFSCRIGSWGFDKYGKRLKAFRNKRMLFDTSIAKRLEHTQIENNDAIKVIHNFDTEDTFHYIDPPYIETNMGHYKGYSMCDYKRLLEKLSTIKGKFLLSGFPNDILDEYIAKNNWHINSFDKPKTAAKAVRGKPRLARKTEVLVANYPIQ